MSIEEETDNQRDYRMLRLLNHRDNLLTFQQLVGKTIDDMWQSSMHYCINALIMDCQINCCWNIFTEV